ncbi:PIN domain-containing protein [Mucilaginibacter phyllosphaerae]|uniref:Nucleic acid-binding protein n=1 Tax=Mucilaginibacter phyllosphaerae TaxID=1812349 RepID=A0A4Y8AF97_9SPHI|nr:PIN domain-containing protein [Mucilaginibacter phyllosphaerae]MBB3968975.1 putative nucleic acid-binding protein [Mucilaginibacter phyllosphaerae]TEW67403.1 PIN domain-containing protein [Mucilaginibacter phyllosphaerae]GGH23189.1 PIN domain-containing protein [Mucilaginibacter phyllosphaerae]
MKSMAYKVLFIDSDILLDTILIRQPHFNYSAEVVKLADNNAYTLCASVHSLLNIHYATKRAFNEALARQAILVLTERLNIIKEDAALIKQAAGSDFSDFEDAVQYYAAKSAGADAIITRNIKDYKQATIPVFTAEQFLRTL